MLTDKHLVSDKFARWEALRERVNTIGARDALHHAMHKRLRGSVAFEYLWMLVVTGLLMVVLSRCVGPDTRDPEVGSHIPAEVKGGHGAGLR